MSFQQKNYPLHHLSSPFSLLSNHPCEKDQKSFSHPHHMGFLFIGPKVNQG